jgi:hypothetical protein
MCLALKRALLGIACSAFGTAALADAFCDPLKAVVADSPANFATIRGHADAGDATRFSHPLEISGAIAMLAGAAPCSVMPVAGSRRYSYDCTFPGPSADDVKPALSAFLNRVAACLKAPPVSFDSAAPANSSNSGPYQIVRDGVVISAAVGFAPDGGNSSLFMDIAAKD